MGHSVKYLAARRILRVSEKIAKIPEYRYYEKFAMPWKDRYKFQCFFCGECGIRLKYPISTLKNRRPACLFPLYKVCKPRCRTGVIDLPRPCPQDLHKMIVEDRHKHIAEGIRPDKLPPTPYTFPVDMPVLVNAQYLYDLLLLMPEAILTYSSRDDLVFLWDNHRGDNGFLLANNLYPYNKTSTPD